MAQQLEPGKGTPLRPSTIFLTAQSAFTHNVDSSPPVDWTQSASRIPLAIATQLMDDTNPKRLTLSSNFLQLSGGIWLLQFSAVLVNAQAAIKGVRVAFTNSTGATVHRESPVFEVPASSTGFPIFFEAVIHLAVNTGTKTEVQVRSTQTTATAGLSIASGNPVLMVTRIGNANEA